MTGVLLAFLSGIFTGGADFLGGVAGRRASVPAVSALAFAVSAVGAVLISPLIGGSLTAEVWFWGLLAGVGISIGSVALFTGIGFGRVAIVAPLSAVISAAMPVAFEIAIGGRPGFLVWMGIVFAIGAVVLVTRENEQVERSLRLSLVTGVVAGISVGVVYVVISRVAHEGTWVLVPAGIVTSILLWLWLLAHREALLPPRAVRPLTLAVGLMSLLRRRSVRASRRPYPPFCGVRAHIDVSSNHDAPGGGDLATTANEFTVAWVGHGIVCCGAADGGHRNLTLPRPSTAHPGLR